MKKLRIALLVLAGVIAVCTIGPMAMGFWWVNKWVLPVGVTAGLLLLVVVILLGWRRSKNALRKALRALVVAALLLYMTWPLTVTYYTSWWYGSGYDLHGMRNRLRVSTRL